jgi:CoA:oxalate CoA-transferase
MRPLVGIRVLDLSRVVSGPTVGRIFSDLGADVVKVEPPEGDVSRLWGLSKHGVSGFFQQQNVGKRNISIDFRKPDGVALLIELVTKADVLIENYRGGVMDRLGIGWTTLAAANPKLVMCSISGFGQQGPESQRQAYASVIQSEAGWVSRLSECDNRRPSDPIVSVADYNAGLHGVIGVLAALRAAQITNIGTHIDIAMLDSMLFTDDYMHHAIDNHPVDRLGGEYWELGDGTFIEVAGQFKYVWARLHESFHIADPTPAGVNLEEKIRHRRGAVEEFFAGFANVDEAVIALDQAVLPWGRYNTANEALETPTSKHRGVVVQVDDRSGTGTTRGVIQTPYRFTAYESGVDGHTSHRGEDNAAVLFDWLGRDAKSVDGLQQADVLLQDLPTEN